MGFMTLTLIDNFMGNLLKDVRARIGKLVNGEINRNKTFYVAEITGEDPQYGLKRDFLHDKRSPYSLDRGHFEDGRVYEIKDDREDLRCWFQITGRTPDKPYPFQIITLDRGDSCDENFVLDHVPGHTKGDGDESGGVAAGTTFENGKAADVADRLKHLTDDQLDEIDAMIDAQTLNARKADGTTGERIAAMADDVSADEPRITDDETRVNLGNVPADVRKTAKTHRSAFDAAFEKHMGVEAGPKLKAIASDAAVLSARTDN